MIFFQFSLTCANLCVSETKCHKALTYVFVIQWRLMQKGKGKMGTSPRARWAIFARTYNVHNCTSTWTTKVQLRRKQSHNHQNVKEDGPKGTMAKLQSTRNRHFASHGSRHLVLLLLRATILLCRSTATAVQVLVCPLALRR